MPRSTEQPSTRKPVRPQQRHRRDARDPYAGFFRLSPLGCGKFIGLFIPATFQVLPIKYIF
jgi:hypothetical protein